MSAFNKNDPSISIRHNVVCLALKSALPEYDFEGGLMDAETRELIREAIIIRHGKLQQTLPQKLATNFDDLQESKNIYFYGGILFDNFGHFLLESISRLWAYNIYKKEKPYIFFYCPWGTPDYKKKSNYVHQVLKGFDIPVNRIVLFKNPVILQTVIVPEQQYGYGICRKPGTEFLNFINAFRYSKKVVPSSKNFEKIYVSRSGLPYKMGRPMGEVYFEAYLRSNNYFIFHPEKHSVYEQMSLYSKAKKIIFCDGGSIYSGILLPQLKASIAIIARRRDNRWNYKEITEIFLGYNIPVLWIDEVICQYQFGLETWDAVAEIDWVKVSILLKENGYTENDFKPMNIEDDKKNKQKEIQGYIESISSNPLYLDYMLQFKEQHPILPNSF